MPADSAQHLDGTLREQTEPLRPRMAKADLRKPERVDSREVVGEVLRRALELAGVTRLQQQADLLQRDPRQVARWLDGSERVQADVVWAIERLRAPWIEAWAEAHAADAAGADVRTVITLQRVVGE